MQMHALASCGALIPILSDELVIELRKKITPVSDFCFTWKANNCANATLPRNEHGLTCNLHADVHVHANRRVIPNMGCMR